MINPKCVSNMLYYFIKFSVYHKVASGGVQSFISLKVFRNYLFPLPPFEEQKRIVAKIEELLPYCDSAYQVNWIEKEVSYYR